MFIVWFFWLFVLLGGLVMGLMSLRQLLAAGFSTVLLLNALVYLGCAVAAIPRVWRLLRQPPAASPH
jgi:hypothetical protein